MKYIIWKNYKWYFITFIILLLLIIFIALFIYNVPVRSSLPLNARHNLYKLPQNLYLLFPVQGVAVEKIFGV